MRIAVVQTVLYFEIFTIIFDSNIKHYVAAQTTYAFCYMSITVLYIPYILLESKISNVSSNKVLIDLMHGFARVKKH